MYSIEVIFCLTLISTLVYISAEYLSLYLPMKSKLFDRKPFNCRPCLTFHLSWVTFALFALICGSFGLFVIGLIYAFIIFFIVYRIDKNKIIE